jgi:nucleoid-associated protein
MQVNRLVIHQLEKEARTRGTIIYHSSNFLVPVNDGVNRMYGLIHDSFEKDKTRYCKYKLAETTNAVMLNTNLYLANMTDAVFLTYTKASLSVLAAKIRSEVFATGGYYLFADYSLAGRRFMSIIIARKKDGFNIEWQGADQKFDFLDTKNVNTDKLAMGYRLNVELYNTRTTEDRNYIALLTNQGESISDYFLEWVNATDSVNGRVQTGILVGAIKNLAVPEGENDADFQSRAFGYIDEYRRANRGVVNVDAISQALYGDAATIKSYIENDLQTEIDPEIHADLSTLKKLIQIKARVKGIDITIDSSKFSTQEVSLEGDALIIRNRDLVSQIREQQNG